MMATRLQAEPARAIPDAAAPPSRPEGEQGRLHVYFVTDEPYPVGMAATNRIRSLGKGFVEQGAVVKVICLRPTEEPGKSSRQNAPRGCVDGIGYEYSCGTTVRASAPLMRKLLKARGMLNAALILARDRKQKGIRRKGVLLLHMYACTPLTMIYFYCAARIAGLAFAQDKSEFPYVLLEAGRFGSGPGRLYARIYTSTMYKLLDAMLLMTKPLEAYFLPRIRRRARTLIVPMTVDASRFRGNGHASSPHPGLQQQQREEGKGLKTSPAGPIVYCGSLAGEKDGVGILIRSFALLPEEFSGVQLVVIGDAPGTGDLERLRELAEALCVGERVVFTGRVPRDEIPRYLCGAGILALARPSGLQSEGGFPSKLGEYLSTGNPVVVTRVGDIPHYLRDGENAFLAEPDDPAAFAAKLVEALSDPRRAREIGRRGRETALEHFDYHHQAKRAVAFFEELVSP